MHYFKPGDQVCAPSNLSGKIHTVENVYGFGREQLIKFLGVDSLYYSRDFEMFEEFEPPFAPRGLIEALQLMTPDHVLGIDGSDWSWWFQWENQNSEDARLVDQTGKPVVLTKSDFLSKDWILIKRKYLDSI